MSRLFSKTKMGYLMLYFTYTLNFWDFFSEEVNCRAMTEQKTGDAKARHTGVTCNFRLQCHSTTAVMSRISVLPVIFHFPLITTCFLP